MSAAPIYVVVSSHGGEGYRGGQNGTPKHPGGPIVHETDVGTASTLEKAQERAAMIERRWGACRIARLVFEDHPAFNEVRGLCGECDCPYFGKPRAGTCACGRAPA